MFIILCCLILHHFLNSQRSINSRKMLISSDKPAGSFQQLIAREMCVLIFLFLFYRLSCFTHSLSLFGTFICSDLFGQLLYFCRISMISIKCGHPDWNECVSMIIFFIIICLSLLSKPSIRFKYRTKYQAHTLFVAFLICSRFPTAKVTAKKCRIISFTYVSIL